MAKFETQLLCLLLNETSLMIFDTWTMDASSEAPSELPKNTSPFCGKEFRRLGNHLSHYKKREGGDYSSYLATKTLDKRARISSKKACPKCHRTFTRLDTHLKNNAFCKSIPQDESPDQCSVPNNHQEPPALSSIHTLTTAQQLPPNATLEQPPTAVQQLTRIQNISQDLPQCIEASIGLGVS